MLNLFSAEKMNDYKNGSLTDCYKYFGSSIEEKCVTFALWAPLAKSVIVVGDFNDWGRNGRLECRMHKNEHGIWTCKTDLPKEGQKYKYLIERCDGTKILKSDPYGVLCEVRPNTATIIYKDKHFKWNDEDWMTKRKTKDYIHQPLNIYEVHIGSWKRDSSGEGAQFLNYRLMADDLSLYLKEMNYTHVELMPVTEHPFDGSWGYQTLCYYAVTSRYGTPEDFKYFVDVMHNAGIGVIMDWVPGHFCKDESGLYNFDGGWTYEYENSLQRENVLWGTANFDLGKGTVQSFLISNAVYFLKEYHIDGIRVDAVSNMIYDTYENREKKEGIAFLRKLNKAVFENVCNPVMIAEDSSAWPGVTKSVYAGGLGFTFKWNMGWMNDSLEYMGINSLYRKWHHEKITFSIMYAFKENYVLPLSHDEVVHGKRTLIDKMFGDYDTKFDALRLYFLYMIMHPGKKLSFMGNEFAPFLEWRYYEELEWKMLLYKKHADMKEYVKALNKFYIENKSLWEKDDSDQGFMWIDANNSEQSVFSFARKAEDADDFIIAVFNFTPVEYESFKIGVPRFADYKEIFSSKFDGKAEKKVYRPGPNSWNGMPFCINIKLPGYGATVYKPVFRKSTL